LQAELGRLRLRLRQRVLELRKLWKRAPAAELQSLQGVVITDADVDLLLDMEAGSLSNEQEDQGSRQTAEALALQETRIEEAGQLTRSAGAPPALEILSRLFQLGRYERDLLLLCLAPEIDSGFERLYAYAQDEAPRKYLTAGLARDLFRMEAPGHDVDIAVRAALASEAPLRRFRLLQSEPVAGQGWQSEP